jgi:hypothetical protein
MSKDEHPDNMRFLSDVEKWTGVSVEKIGNEKYKSVDDVFSQTRYMAGISGARCTAEMKKIPRFAWGRADDINVFGFTADEYKRKSDFVARNPDLIMEWPLFDSMMTKRDCLRLVKDAGIELPTLYKLGFQHNNCIGCVKATSSAYWNMVREHFPDTFNRRAEQSREIGCRLVRHKGERIFLDELPRTARADLFENISCGPECGGVSRPEPPVGDNDNQEE